MKRPRPYIPIVVRLIVAHRHLEAMGIFADRSKGLRSALWLLFRGEPCHLDHAPPLRVRKFYPRRFERAKALLARGAINRRDYSRLVAASYEPNANAPEHLIYRSAADHRLKTNVRGDGAQFPDRVLIKREKRREKKKTAKPRQVRRTLKYAASGLPTRYSGYVPKWAKGRKIPSRPFPRRP